MDASFLASLQHVLYASRLDFTRSIKCLDIIKVHRSNLAHYMRTFRIKEKDQMWGRGLGNDRKQKKYDLKAKKL